MFISVPFKNSVPTSQKTQLVPIANTILLTLFEEIGLISVYSENYAKIVNLQCGRKVRDYLTVKQMVCVVTSLL
jgi:hypothetical protein